jgi:cytochrome c553
MPKHVVRLVLLLVGLGVFAVTARTLLVDKSFYRYGHYRGDAVVEIARDKPKLQGNAYCLSCHAAQVAQWSTSVHNRPDLGKAVKCEVCHGPGGGRDPEQGYIHAATGPLHPANLKLAIPTDSRALCTLCHEKMPGRPKQQAQISIEDHAGTQQCTLCHNPHSPRTFIGAPAQTAQTGDAAMGKDKAQSCVRCHGEGGVGVSGAGPALAGQNPDYLVATIKAYKSGERDDVTMKALLRKIAEADYPDIVAYYASLKCDGPQSAEDRAATARQAGASLCVNCHGTNGISGAHSAPNLNGQSKAYLADTLKAYASGDRTHIVMSALTKGMSDADAEKLADYYAGATCK